MKKNLLFFCCLLSLSFAKAQTSEKLQPTKIIGTAYSVNYETDQVSTTVNTIANAFDGNYDTFFASYERSNTWVGLDLGEAHVITKVAYSPRKTRPERVILGIFEGANLPDFADAVPLYMVMTAAPEGKMTEQTVNNSRGFRYVRYIGPNYARCNIAELAFYGYKSKGDDTQFMQQTNIPDVIIHTTNSQQILDRENYVKGIINIISNNGQTIFSDSVEIRGRGNYSWTNFDKKPYRFKLLSKSQILNFPAEARNWALLSNHSDKTLIRNLLAFDISKRVKTPYTPAGRLVNFYLNGEYQGCYQLCDHIDVREKRVNVTEMKPTDITGDKLTGGYLIEVDAYAGSPDKWFQSNRGTKATIKSPKKSEIMTRQYDYIRDHFNRWETSVYASNFSDPNNGFRRYMDTYSFICHFLVGELAGNTDTYWSTFMYKQRGDDKFYFGPVWDFDIAFENDNRTYPINTKYGYDWLYQHGSVEGDMRNIVNRVLSDAALYSELRKTYANYRDWGYLTEEKLMKVIDNYVAEIDASQKLNFTRWDVLNQKIHQNNQPAGSYIGEINVVKNFLKERLKWMDTKLNYVYDPTNTDPYTEIGETFKADFQYWTNHSQIYVNNKKPACIEIFHISGKLMQRAESQNFVSVPLEQGVYVVRVLTNGNTQTVKCVIG